MRCDRHMYYYDAPCPACMEDEYGSPPSPNGDGLPVPLDWHALFKRETDVDWLVEDVWPAGRQLHIFAARKTGKSLLMLWIAACLAAGRDPFTGRQREPIRVAYLDFEMTEDDVLERVEEMGFGPDDLEALRYYLWPVLPPLDSNEGGTRLLRLVERDQAQAVVIDTVARVVNGGENDADTFRDFFVYTGMRLKRAGISLARLDHEGHEAGRARGSSAKADDVDVVWRLQATDDGLALVKRRPACRGSPNGSTSCVNPIRSASPAPEDPGPLARRRRRPSWTTHRFR
jgi:AAA domain